MQLFSGVGKGAELAFLHSVCLVLAASIDFLLGVYVSVPDRLRSNTDIRRVRRLRDSVSLKSMLAYRSAAASHTSRLGIAVSKRTGNAVRRNRIRRRLRAAFAVGIDAGFVPMDIFAVGRSAAVELPFNDLIYECRRVFEAPLRQERSN